MKLPVVGWRQVGKVLASLGYGVGRQRGDHMLFVKKGCKSIPVQRVKELSPGNIKSIIRSTGLTKEEFIEILQGL
ncbi:MAG: type II toxin-antitoxin system HicA family toxin [Candidatus Aenigmarchaeota archaeon]|nr:type II toxin-antitoxin system HicA family toxin [Candidatus Aenigmarchaeota archaeon]